MTVSVYNREKIEEKIKSVIGLANDFRWGSGSVIFKTLESITFKEIEALSKTLGTDLINFNFGHSGEPGYSEYTPGISGEPGYIEVFYKNLDLV